MDPQAISSLIKKTVSSELDEQILNMFLVFNKHLLKTNFYKKDKSALSFRFDPSFLANNDIPEVPFAVFLVLGREFRGFHLRFRDIARGGIRYTFSGKYKFILAIRIIRSANQQVHNRNKEFVFDENYGLAFTV